MGIRLLLILPNCKSLSILSLQILRVHHITFQLNLLSNLTLLMPDFARFVVHKKRYFKMCIGLWCEQIIQIPMRAVQQKRNAFSKERPAPLAPKIQDFQNRGPEAKRWLRKAGLVDRPNKGRYVTVSGLFLIYIYSHRGLQNINVLSKMIMGLKAFKQISQIKQK